METIIQLHYKVVVKINGKLTVLEDDGFKLISNPSIDKHLEMLEKYKIIT